MADVSHLPSSRSTRSVRTVGHGGIASLAAHFVFAAAVIFAAAIVLGLVN
jgi:hypothetical protein